MSGYLYTNSWTGQVVPTDEKDPFFESEAVWERSDAPDEAKKAPAKAAAKKAAAPAAKKTADE